MRRPATAAACLAFVIVWDNSRAAAQPANTSCSALKEILMLPDAPPMPRVDCRIERGCLRVDWNIVQEQQISETLALFRFSEKTPLKIHTANVNLLQFAVTWTAKAEPQDKAFEATTKLFESIFPVISAITQVRGTNQGAARELAAWVVPLEYANNCLAQALSHVNGVVLDRTGDTNRQALHQARYYVGAALPRLSERRDAFLGSFTEGITADDWDVYLKVAERHTDFERRSAEFLPLAQRSVEGVLTTIEAQPRNSVVTLTGQASTRTGEAAGGAITAKYFVATSRPLAYHVGYAYGRIRDINFKQVRAASGQDVFTAVASENNRAADTSDRSVGADPVAFMTWEFARSGPNGRYGAGLTLGTGLDAPEKSFYFGGSTRIFTRVFVTAGAVVGVATRGDGAVTDTASGASRTVFSTLREVSAVKGFWSVSFKVY
jgi:hypothetical protein